MKYAPPADSPDAYIEALTGWRRTIARDLRASIRAAAVLEECIKWGNLVYLFSGPVLVVRAEEERVLFGFWRGKMLRDLNDRLVPGGKYDMATITYTQGDKIDVRSVKRLVKAAVALNKELGDPTAVARKPGKSSRKRKFASIAEYLSALEPAKSKNLKRVLATIRKAVPDSTGVISYGIPAFKQDRVFIYCAAFKQHIGIYPPVRGDASLQAALAPFANAKGNLSFPLDQPMPLALVARVARALAREYARSSKSRPRR